MPRLNHRFQEGVFFLFGHAPRDGSLAGPLGTGAFISVNDHRGVPIEIYAVTCAHVAPACASIIRLNTIDGKSRFLEFEPDEWQIAGDSDLAAVDVTERINDADAISCISHKHLMDKQFIKDVSLGIGEDGFMLGLFSRVPSTARNVVAARFGNISMLASDDVLIKRPNGVKRPAHIFDMRSRPGFSGSPVFVYRIPSGDLRDVRHGRRRKTAPPPRIVGMSGRLGRGEVEKYYYDDYNQELDAEDNPFLMMLGIHAAQYTDVVEVRKANTNLEADYFKDGDQLTVPGSMTIVIPAWEIRELLNKLQCQDAHAKRRGAARG